MADPSIYNRAQVTIEAVRLASNADIQPLRQLIIQQPQILKLEFVLRILLTFLPESTDPALYRDLLNSLSAGLSPESVGTQPLIVTLPEEELSEDDAVERVQKLHLLPLADPETSFNGSPDLLTTFLLHRAHRIDSETGSLPLVAQLLAPFADHSEFLRTWMISTLCPVLRLDYEYYPHRAPPYSLQQFERLDGAPAIDSLLSQTAQSRVGDEQPDIGRDLRGLVGPWIYGENERKRRRLSVRRRRRNSVAASLYGAEAESDEIDSSEHAFGGWAHVNEWLLHLAVRNFPRAVDAVVQWDGPGDVDYGEWGAELPEKSREGLRLSTEQYTQASLAAIYATSSSSVEILEGSRNILAHVAQRMDLHSPPPLDVPDTASNANISPEYFKTLSHTHFLHDSLLGAQNPLTRPSQPSISLAFCLLASAHVLERFGHSKSCKSVTELSLSGSESDQLVDLRKVLYKLQAEAREEKSWETIRQQMLWLRNWSWLPNVQDSDNPRGMYCKIRRVDLEIEILKVFLNASCYNLAVDTYCRGNLLPLPADVLEKIVLNSALSSYDAASNGNRNRGGVRKASDILTTFRDYFPQSKPLSHLQSLLSATHAMSFYSLTLQHGVPLQPVEIRAHQDPLSLIEKILGLNPGSYTKLDDLIEIGKNLVAAGLGQMSDTKFSKKFGFDEALLVARRRITGMAIEAALAEEDFDTAYSYIINRLSPSTTSDSNDPALSSTSAIGGDDVSWRAAYQAGRHRSRKSAGPSSLRRLEQRMELLSQALLLAPSHVLPEILSAWRQCEDEMSHLIAKETKEDQIWDDKGDRKIPGGFTGDSSPVIQKQRDPAAAAANEEAPMGLFDVARGAAAALSKNAFLLRAPRTTRPPYSSQVSHQRPRSVASAGGSDDDSLSAKDGEGRVRKRDMVSSMVTGGLASGLGWVLGAPPVRHE